MIWQRAKDLEQRGDSFVTITIIGCRGAIPQELGVKCLVSDKGLERGTIGGGKVEAKAIERAREILKSEGQVAPLSLTWNLQRDVKMTCGGEVTLLFEHFPGNHWPIALFGAGHVGQALSRGLANLQCQLTVIDNRKEWLNRLEGVRVLHREELKDAVQLFSERTFFICMTQGHAHDVPILSEILKTFPNAPYIGVIGSKSKANAIKKDLMALGVGEKALQSLRVPIGLPLGSNCPEEISISIMAELLQVRDRL